MPRPGQGIGDPPGLVLKTTNLNQIMGFLKIVMAVFMLLATWMGGLPVVAESDSQGITENECARLEDAEIVWDLSIYRWMCCMVKNENEYETCIPITDMKPLPKTSLKPFPPNTTQTIKPQDRKK